MHAPRRGEETRNRILQAAEEGFAQNGYEATGVAEICARANLSKGAFYHHFPSKQAVFLELLERWLANLEAHLQDLWAQATSVPEALLEMAGVVGQVFQAADGRLPIFLEFWTQAAHDPAVWEATIAPYRRFRRFFAEMIAQGIAEGSLRPTDPERTAQVILSLAMGVLLQGLLDPEGADWGQTAREGMETLLRALQATDGS